MTLVFTRDSATPRTVEPLRFALVLRYEPPTATACGCSRDPIRRTSRLIRTDNAKRKRKAHNRFTIRRAP